MSSRLDPPVVPLDPQDPLSSALRNAVDEVLTAFLDARRPQLEAIGPELGRMSDLAEALMRGGKRMRPAFCLWSAVAAGGLPADPQPMLRASASLDLLHISALVHDDVMDDSDLRRGLPAAHHQFAATHREGGWLGDSGRFGQAGAILLGNLLMAWSVEMFERCGLSPDDLDRGRPVAEVVRTEVNCGQYLDVIAQHQPIADPTRALETAGRIVEYKTARYTVIRPCQLGASLAGGTPGLISALEAYGSPLGRAYQFRDDLLGVFGDESATGKPTGDDLREGKRTSLIAHAHAGTTSAGRATLDALFGQPDLDDSRIQELQALIVESGAVDRVEEMVEESLEQALAALDTAATDMTDAGRTALTALAHAAVRRVA